MANVEFRDFDMDSGMIAPAIYGSQAHRVTNRGVVLSSEVTSELRRFLAGFNACTHSWSGAYYRIDAYFDPSRIVVLEINAFFVDGWGTALNLSRAAGITVSPGKLSFPAKFASLESVYRPELELFVDELRLLGIPGEVVSINSVNDLTETTYVYGRVDGGNSAYLFPLYGRGFDNKMNLARFSQRWDGSLVTIPSHYSAPCPWEEIPRDAVLKFCDKGSQECLRAGWSVNFGKPRGKAPFLRRCYRDRELLAQDRVEPTRWENQNCQLAILAIGSEPITGYVQYGRKRIVNDDSVHGPLQFC